MKKSLLLVISLCCTVVAFAQKLTEKQLKVINKSTHSVHVDLNYSNGNWSSISKEIKGKSIVLLGELNHGSKENFDTRNDLIKYLHEKEGFNTILFEAGIGELVILNDRKKKYSPEFMTLGFYGIWRTQEFANLMAYVKEKNIAIAGFDVQKGSGGAFLPLMEMEAKKKDIPPKLYNRLDDRFDLLEDELKKKRTTVYDSLSLEVNQLIKDYKSFFKALSVNEKHFSKNLMYINQTVNNRVRYLNYRLDFLKDKDYHKRWKARDSAMADNISWLKEYIFKDEKIIVVGHNFHISKYNENEEVAGEYLKKKYPNETYSIGFFIGDGEYANNGGELEKMDPINAEKLDVRHIINAINDKVCFMPMPIKTRKNNKWLFEEVVVNNSFVDLNRTRKLSLAKSFDGLVFIDKTSMPIKIDFSN
nr:erythromycin esterase family protein [uncultured Psychroserpens sp.]